MIVGGVHEGVLFYNIDPVTASNFSPQRMEEYPVNLIFWLARTPSIFFLGTFSSLYS